MPESRFSPDLNSPRIESLDNGRVVLYGDLTFETVGELFATSSTAVDSQETTTLDLEKVTRTDSAGLALLVEWLRQARRRNSRIEITNMPEQMRSIARMSKLDGVLLADRG